MSSSAKRRRRAAERKARKRARREAMEGADQYRVDEQALSGLSDLEKEATVTVQVWADGELRDERKFCEDIAVIDACEQAGLEFAMANLTNIPKIVTAAKWPDGSVFGPFPISISMHATAGNQRQGSD